MADAGKNIGPTQLTGAAATIYTAPTSPGKFYMRHVRFVNTSGSPVAVYMSIGADAVATRWISGFAVPANDVEDWSGFEVVGSSVIIQAWAAVASVVNLIIDGVEET
jgi:hypothetical protein